MQKKNPRVGLLVPQRKEQFPSFQVRDEFFDTVDNMIARLFERGQDPTDKAVPSSFCWKTWGDIPPQNKYNMDEMGSDTNKSRRKKVAGVLIFCFCTFVIERV